MNMLRKIGSNLALQLIIMISVVMIAGDYIPMVAKEFIYTISLLIKDLLVLALPYIIFAYIFSTLLSLKNGAVLFILSLLASIVVMNFLGLNIAYRAGQLLVDLSGVKPIATDTSKELLPMWRLPISNYYYVKLLWQNIYGLILGVVAGIILAYLNIKNMDQWSVKLKSGADFILNQLFIPVVPFFILGFILKMQHEGTLIPILKQYGPVYLIIAIVQITYLLILFTVGAKLNPSEWFRYLRNMLPPAITGISTMSSAAALPFSLKAAEENTQNIQLSRSVIPATVNINLMGDSLGVPLMIMATMIIFGLDIPTYGVYLVFALQYLGYMFTVAAVPGATINIMIPIIQSVLGFNDEMISLVTALYILYDAIGTVMNVLGNGAFVILYNRVFGRIFSKSA